ncbi:MAG: PKD domain-containing protein [Bacteroidia bacterium]
MLRFLTRLWLFVCLLLVFNQSQATHFMGVDVSFLCLPGGCTYRVYTNVYMDCEGAATPIPPIPPTFPPGTPTPPPFPPPIGYTPGNAPGMGAGSFGLVGNPVGCNVPALTFGTAGVLDYYEVPVVCPTVTTSCQGGVGAVAGVVGATYYWDVNLCNTNCSTVSITWDNCCLNGAIVNITNPMGQGIGTNVTTIDLTLGSCNSSPIFSEPPVPYVCDNQAYTFNQGAFDPDNDSLSYALGPCLNWATFASLPYAPGYSAASPLGANWTVTVDPASGDVTVAPTPGGAIGGCAVVCVYVTEWRHLNGSPIATQIGQTERQIQMCFTACPNNILPIALTNPPPPGPPAPGPVGSALTGLTGATQIFNSSGQPTMQINACVGVPINFNFGIVDYDAIGGIAGDSLCMGWSQNIPGLIFSNAAPGGYPASPPNPYQQDEICVLGDSVIANIQWTPVGQGTYFLTFYAHDNACPINGKVQYTLIINVQCCTFTPGANIAVSNCFTLDVHGLPGCGPAPHTYVWQGIFAGTPNVQDFQLTLPGPGTYNYALTVIDGNGNSGTFFSNVTVANNAVANAGPDLSLCPNQVGTIGTPGLPGYTYSWDAVPNIGFASPPANSAQEQVAMNNQTVFNSPVVYTLFAIDSLGCPASDQVNVDFLPLPSSIFSVTPEICKDGCATVNYVGTPPSGATYNWTFAPGVSSSATGPGPHQVCYSSAGTFPVSLQVTAGGCASNVHSENVLVHETPSSNFTAISPVCAGQATTLTYAPLNGYVPGPSAIFDWDFAGGTVVSLGNNTYQVEWALPGTYLVTLTVEEFGCASLQTVVPVTVNSIPSSDFSVPANICMNDANQIVYIGGTVPSANSTFNWNFGNAVILTGSGAGPYTVSWTTPGTKQICLQVTDGGCVSQQLCKTVNVLPKPIASIVAVGDSCLDGNAYNFQYNGTPSYDAIYWDFADGIPSSSTLGTPPPVSFLTPGPRTISVYVIKDGCVSETATVTFNIKPEPTAMFNMTTNMLCLGDQVDVTFTGPVLSAQQSYSWSFGAGATPTFSTAPDTSVAFNTPGLQTITLAVEHLGCTDTMTQTLTTSANSVIVSAGQDNSICDGAGPAQLNGSVFGGTAPYSFVWAASNATGGLSSPNVEDPLVNPTVCTSYGFTAIDAYGCRSNVDSVEICVKPRPIAKAGGDRFICDAPGAFCTFLNGSVGNSLQVPGPYQYSWFPNTGMAPGQDSLPNPCAHPASNQIYTLVVYAANGCSSVLTTLDTVSTTTVDVRPVPLVNAGVDKVICEGSTTMLNAFASGTGGPYTYTWTPNGPNAGITSPYTASPTVGPNFTTQYTVTAETNGCQSSDSVIVTVNTKPTAAIEPPVADICQNQNIMLYGLANGVPLPTTYTYSWDPPLGLAAPDNDSTLANPLTTQTYSLYGSAQGCTFFLDQVTVNVKPTPITDITRIDTTICYGTSIPLQAVYSFNGATSTGPFIYNWTPAAGLSAANVANVTAQPTQTTTYYVTISVSSGCITKDSVTINVTPEINPQITADTSMICGAGSTMLYAAGGSGNPIYQWTPATAVSSANGSQVSTTATTSTQYILTIREGFCTESDTFNLTVNPQPVADYVASHLKGCSDLEVNFMEQATDEVSYIWNFGDGSPVSNMPNPTHHYTSPGVYPVSFTAVGIGGCNTTVSLGDAAVSDTTFGDFSSSAPIDSILLVPNATITFTDETSNSTAWLWDFGDGTTSAEHNPVHTYQTPGEYTVTLTVTNEDGCISHVIRTPYRVEEPGLNVPNVFSPNGDGLYDTWAVLYNGKEKIKVEVFDRWGTPLFETENLSKQWNGTNKGGAMLNDGVYFYNIKVGNKIYTGNVTIIK